MIKILDRVHYLVVFLDALPGLEQNMLYISSNIVKTLVLSHLEEKKLNNFFNFINALYIPAFAPNSIRDPSTRGELSVNVSGGRANNFVTNCRAAFVFVDSSDSIISLYLNTISVEFQVDN